MKKVIAIIFVTCFLFTICPLGITAEEATDDFVFELNPNGEGYILTACRSNEETVVIPSEYNGLPVRAIAPEYHLTFKDCTSIKKIILPDTLLSCGNKYSFIPYSSDGVITTYGEIDFNEWENGLYLGTADNPYYALVSVVDVNVTQFVMHEDTEIIGAGVFFGCCQLEDITLSESLKYIHPDSLQIAYEEYYTQYGKSEYQPPIKYNEYGNCYYLGTKDNPYYALIKPLLVENDEGEFEYASPIEIHPDTELITATGTRYALKDQTVVIPKLVKAVCWYALYGSENATIRFKAESEDQLLYPLYNGEISETVSIFWGGDSQPADGETGDGSFLPDGSGGNGEDGENGNAWIYVLAVGLTAAVVVAAVWFFINKKNAKE